jgi:hypothetical protein
MKPIKNRSAIDALDMPAVDCHFMFSTKNTPSTLSFRAIPHFEK